MASGFSESPDLQTSDHKELHLTETSSTGHLEAGYFDRSSSLTLSPRPLLTLRSYRSMMDGWMDGWVSRRVSETTRRDKTSRPGTAGPSSTCVGARMTLHSPVGLAHHLLIATDDGSHHCTQ